MRRLAAPLLLSLSLASAIPVVRAEVTEEDHRRLESEVRALTERCDRSDARATQLNEKITQLREENARLRNEIGLAGKDNASRDQLKKVVEQIEEVDRKRVADGKLVREQLDSIAKLASKPVVLPPVEEVKTPKPKAPVAKKDDSKKNESAPPEAKHADDGPELPAEYYEHVVAEGETLGVIIAAYNKEKGLKVRQAHVLKANPKLKDPKKLYVGMKLQIPAVK